MNCIEFRQMLEQSFGQAAPDDETVEHLKTCADCREYWEGLVELAQEMPSDSQFSVDDVTIDALVQKVEDAIQPSVDIVSITQQKSDDAWPKSLMRFLPAAAAVLLVVGVGIGGYFIGKTNFGSTIAIADQPVVTILGSTDDSEYDEPDDPTFEVLLTDFVTDRPYDAAEKLLDDITDEEMEYLAQNFDVGDLL